nr:MAG TPA: bacteriocin [Caudoviricetes sp.]
MSKELFYSLLLFLYKPCIEYKFNLYLQIKCYYMNERYQIGYIKQKPYSLNTPSLEDIPETPSMLNSNDWLNNIGSIVGGISGVIGTSLQNSRIDDASDVEDQINSATNYKVGAYSNESLLDEWGNYNPLDYVTYSDIRGGNVAQRGLNTLSSIGSGAMGGGSIGGPIGAIIGGVAGLGSSIAGWLTGNAKARRKVKELNDKIDAANRHVQGSFVNSARSIDEINDMSILSNYSAYGGPINMRAFSPMSPFGNRYSKGGSIRIKPSKRGTFTAAAKKHGKSVQAFASQVLANKENYSPAMVKKANFARNAAKWKHADGGNLNPYSAGSLVNAIYDSSVREEFLGKPSHNYDFTISEEEANKLGYYPDERGHRDDKVKKSTHPTHNSRGKWNSFEEFRLTDKGMENPNYTLFGLVDGNQDPQAVMTYKGGVVLPEITVTPKESYIMNPYDNIKIFDKGGSLTNKKSSSRRLNNNYKEGEIYDVTEEEVKLLKELGYEFEYV